ncbi:MAG: hypothetical protein PHQ60_09365 [Sideroxydans sp.]|nr:hypothetical protein [Sideroxydans sp.]
MFGLAYLAVFGVYLLASVGAVMWAVGYARKNGKSAMGWGLGVAFVMYNIVFWDWIPTVAVHQYYCEKEAGFWVYKTLDQWKAENPGVMEGLVDNSPNEKYPNWPTEDWAGKKITSINQRLGILYKDHLSSAEESELFLNGWRWKTELVDKKTGEVLARRIDFSTGNGGYTAGMHSMRFWLASESCINGIEHSANFNGFLQQFRGARK